MKITDQLKVNDKVTVTLIKKGEFTHLEEGKKTKFKVDYKGSTLFTLKQSCKMPLTHFNAWETSYGVFEIDRGMVIRIEKRVSLLVRIINWLPPLGLANFFKL